MLPWGAAVILVTVGTQLPFDRLTKMIDDLAPSLDREFFGQIGRGSYKPRHFAWSEMVDADEFERRLRDCSAIVSHAGIGTLLKAYKFSKPIIMVPRRAALGEHRNDHQLATVAGLSDRIGVYVAETPEKMHSILCSNLEPVRALGNDGSNKAKLVAHIDHYVGRSISEY